MTAEAIFEPLQLGPLKVKNRVLRSSMGGRTSYFDGTVSPAWAVSRAGLPTPASVSR